ncbi:MAG: CAP domain-containing protein [Lachnospiraceae bacterium]|nr:CAP domain-containing protein [Lachnospiraceae bacterium]
MKTKKHITRLLHSLLMLTLLFCMSLSVRAEGTVPVSLRGTFDYKKAYEALNYTNKIRENVGRKPLQMDAELLEAAMQRAAEIQLVFSHTRPDGTSCFSASGKMFGENIAAGQSTAAAVTNDWKNSSGHYQNMVNSNYTSIGIGCFTQGQTYYWVQCFGIEPASVIAQPANRTDIAAVNIEDSLASSYLYVDLPENMTLGKSKSKTMTLLFDPSATQSLNTAVLTYREFSVTSSDPGVLSVNSSGTIKGLKAGSSTVTLTHRTSPWLTTSFQIQVTDPNSRTVKLNANGGSLSKTASVKTQTKIVTNKQKYGTLPKAYRKGYLFQGWYTKKSGGTKITASKKVSISKTQTLYAHWSKVTVTKPALKTAAKKSGGKASVSWKKVSGAKGYEVLCSTTKNFKKGTYQSITVKSSKSSAAFSGMTKGKRYYFKIRAYKTDSLGKKVYSKYSSVKSLTYR